MRSQQHASLEAIARHGGMFNRIKARIPTYLADFRENPAWLGMFVLARLMVARRAHWLAAKPAAASPSQLSMFADLSLMQAVHDLRTQGVCTGFRLPEAIRTQMHDFALNNTCYGNFDREVAFLPQEQQAAEQTFGRSILSGHYFEKILQCDAALAIQGDPLLAAISAHYLGGQARVVTTRLWWSFPSHGASEADKSMASLDKYHFDLDDWRMLKFFFYITPVDAESGPHVYVRGSHKRRALRHQMTLVVGHPVEDVLRAYGHDKPLTILGEAGTGFVEDPFGFHMGMVPGRSPRLMLEVGFGVSPPSRRRFHGEPVVKRYR